MQRWVKGAILCNCRTSSKWLYPVSNKILSYFSDKSDHRCKTCSWNMSRGENLTSGCTWNQSFTTRAPLSPSPQENQRTKTWPERELWNPLEAKGPLSKKMVLKHFTIPYKCTKPKASSRNLPGQHFHTPVCSPNALSSSQTLDGGDRF